MTNEDSIRRAADSMHRQFGSIHALICNAAIALDVPWSPRPLSKNCAYQTLLCNFYGSLWCCEHFLPLISQG
jgi:NAD(P)-dependent dehydrogenase (short-subunit alcohol dehydrogenase family)